MKRIVKVAYIEIVSTKVVVVVVVVRVPVLVVVQRVVNVLYSVCTHFGQGL